MDKKSLEMREWCEKNKVSPVTQTEISVEQIKNACMNAHDIDLVELEKIILQATAFNIFIKSMKGTLLAQIAGLENEMKRKMGLASQQVEGKYLTRDEKEATVLSTLPDINRVDEELTVLRVRYSKIKDIPLAIDTAIANLKLVYTRKLNESSKQ